MLIKFKAMMGIELILLGTAGGQVGLQDPKCADVKVAKPDIMSTNSLLARTVLYSKSGAYKAPEDITTGNVKLRLIRIENYSDGIVVFGAKIGGRIVSASIRPGNHHTMHMADGSEFAIENLELIITENGGVQVQYVYASGLKQEDFMPKPKEKPKEKRLGEII